MRMLQGILWNWAGVGVVFLTAFFLSPYLIRQLGEQRYGLWALAFAFIDYFILFDFGFKPALVSLLARAQGDSERINSLVATAFYYFSAVGGVLACFTWLAADHLHRFFQISPELQGDFASLVRLIAVGWGLAVALGVFNAASEAFQLFRFQSGIGTLSMVLRSGGCAVALYYGQGLRTLGLIVLLSQAFLFGSLAWNFRRHFPALSLKRRYIRFSVWKELASYGVHAFFAYLGTMMLNQGPPLVVGHLRSEAYVGYYTLPARLLQNLVDLVSRTGYVTVPNVSELAARKDFMAIAHLGTYLNRYCFAMFVPAGVFLICYGEALIVKWVGASFAAQSSPLLTPFVLTTGFAVAGQFNSSQILYGLARHQTYSYLLAGEAVLALGGMRLAIPYWGLSGAAWLSCGLALLNRGLITPWLLSRILNFPLARYLLGIYGRAMVLGALLLAAARWAQLAGWTVESWTKLGLTALLLCSGYYGAAYYFLTEATHRASIQAWVRQKWQAGGLMRD